MENTVYSTITCDISDVTAAISAGSPYEYVLSGRLEIERVNELFDLGLPESDDYLTIGGLILDRYQSFPKLHETVEIDKYSFKIIKVAATKIELVRLKVNE